MRLVQERLVRGSGQDLTEEDVLCGGEGTYLVFRDGMLDPTRGWAPLLWEQDRPIGAEPAKGLVGPAASWIGLSAARVDAAASAKTTATTGKRTAARRPPTASRLSRRSMPVFAMESQLYYRSDRT
jgi:hypothetical protein